MNWNFLTPREKKLFARLTTPEKIQDHLDSLRINFELGGETHRSVREALKHKEAHCIEGALIAAAALWYHGTPPLLLDLMAERGDDDHVVALYRLNGYWGALSKSNHATIRWRDPVYKSVRELALSYFHEWFPEATGRRTLRSYSAPLDLRQFGTDWMTSEKGLWWLDKELNKAKHFPIAPRKNLRALRRADKTERRAGSILEWQTNGQRVRRAGRVK